MSAKRRNEYEEKNIKSSILMLILILSLIVLIICVLLLAGYSLDSYRASRELSELRKMLGASEINKVTGSGEKGEPAGNENTEDAEDGGLAEGTAHSGEVSEKYRALYEMNGDLAGWISIEGTKIDYPVMQTVEDEEYYLHRGFAGQETKEGLPFLDSRCLVKTPSTNMIVYGHNMKSGDMFAELLDYEKPAFLEKHRIIRFDTIYEEACYEVICVFRTKVAYMKEKTFKFYNFIEADSPEDFRYFKEQIGELNTVDTKAECHYGDSFLTLSTCEYTNEDGRFVVIARKVQ